MARSDQNEHTYIARHFLTSFGAISIVVGTAYVPVEGCAIYYSATYAYIGYCIWAAFSWGVVNGAIAINASRNLNMHWCRVSLAMAVINLMVNVVVVVLYSISVNNDIGEMNLRQSIVVDVLKVMFGIILCYVSLHQIIVLDSYAKYVGARNGASPVQVITVQVPAQHGGGQPTIVVQQQTPLAYSYPPPTAPPAYNATPIVPNF